MLLWYHFIYIYFQFFLSKQAVYMLLWYHFIYIYFQFFLSKQDVYMLLWYHFIYIYFQFFLSKQAVYMLLWNMRMGFEHAGLDFWLSSIACHCPEAPVIVVGTQLDQVIVLRRRQSICFLSPPTNLEEVRVMRQEKWTVWFLQPSTNLGVF